MPYHFALKGNKIVCWNGNDSWTEIADVIETRVCKHLIRYANAGEDCENLVDKLISDTAGYKEASCFEIKE